MDALKLLEKLYEKMPNVFSHTLGLKDNKLGILQICICDKSKTSFGLYFLDENDLEKDIDKLVDEIKQMEDNRK